MAINIGNVRRIASLLNVAPTKEPQRAYMFEASFVNDNFSPDQEIRFFVKTVNIPQQAKENIVLDYMDKKLLFAGKDSSAHTINMTFWDDESLTVFRYFNKWMDQMGDVEIGRSVDKNQYARTLKIRLKDTTDFVNTMTVELTNVYPLEMGDVNLTYEGSDIIEIPIVLSFDDKIIDSNYEFNTDVKDIIRNIL